MVLSKADFDYYKNKFINCEYMKNNKIKVDETNEVSIIRHFVDVLGIDIPVRLKGWIETNLVACWGNQKVKCLGQSSKIFEILNSIMEKLKES